MKFEVHHYVHFVGEGVHDINHSLTRLVHIGEHIMTAISTFIEQQNAFNAANSAAIESLTTNVKGITNDIGELNARIKELQESQGTITPEDQALLDAAILSGQQVQAKLAAVSAALAALDDLTPPVPPAQPAP